MSGARLSENDRQVIERGYRTGLPQRTIAALVGKHPSTISRELRRAKNYGAMSPRARIDRGGGKGYLVAYSAAAAHRDATRRALRPKPRRLDHAPLSPDPPRGLVIVG